MIALNVSFLVSGIYIFSRFRRMFYIYTYIIMFVSVTSVTVWQFSPSLCLFSLCIGQPLRPGVES